MDSFSINYLSQYTGLRKNYSLSFEIRTRPWTIKGHQYPRPYQLNSCFEPLSHGGIIVHCYVDIEWIISCIGIWTAEIRKA